MKERAYQICTNCIMDTSDSDISFQENGVCNHCSNYVSKNDAQLVPIGKREIALEGIKSTILKAGSGKKYDCIVGISGGVDSSYVALLAKDLGLRALLVHLDNGWNSDISVKNIRSIAIYTGFDLYTHVIDWNEFRDLQLSLFKASVIDIELATDHAIKAIVYKVAKKFGVKYILSGGNVRTEAIMPVSWRHTKVDRSNLLDTHHRFGKIKLKTYPTAGIIKQQIYKYLFGIRIIPILNYVEFDRNKIITRLTSELGWIEYGGKHHESVFTRFYQGYILPNKFFIDKRRCHLSNLICASQLTRDEALLEIQKDPYPSSMMMKDKKFLLKKLGFSEKSFDEYISVSEVSHFEFKSDKKLILRLHRIREFIRGYIS